MRGSGGITFWRVGIKGEREIEEGFGGKGLLSVWCGEKRDQELVPGPKERTDRDIKVSAGLCLVVSTFGTLGIN